MAATTAAGRSQYGRWRMRFATTMKSDLSSALSYGSRLVYEHRLPDRQRACDLGRLVRRAERHAGVQGGEHVPGRFKRQMLAPSTALELSQAKGVYPSTRL